MTLSPGVAAGHPSTAAAGADILARGGSAADAAVAMMLVSCAAETIFTGLSGGGFATYYDAARQETTCVDFFVSVPGLGGRLHGRGIPIEVSFVGQAVPYDIGPTTVAVPGVPAGARHLWERWGRLDWAEVVVPGLAASYGTPFPAAHAALLPDIAPAMCVGDGAQVYRRPDGEFLSAGDPLRHHDHHRAYELLAEQPEAFYTGEFAEAMLTSVADGGALDTADLQAYKVVESKPREVEVPGYTVAARGNDLDDVLGTLGRAARTVTADPTTDPASALALVEALRGPQRRAETTNIVAVDSEGNGCAVTTSLGLGSGVWVPGFGVHLNSMLGEGELIREPVPPGARLGSMMSPLVALDSDGRLALAAGAAGGSRIRPALVQCVLRILAGAQPQAAIDAPRLHAVPGAVVLEPGFAPHVIGALRQAGNEVALAPKRAAYFGGVSAIGRGGGGADPRRSGEFRAVPVQPRRS
ncbi:MAG: gamma-glutamyltranspeptidase / glutathione hydrolase [Propionibacteriaceae bacterium]|jgi:gamma-glutamyltranspeptidase/glutathione hydrolase|nr:ggt [Propionibacteriaceae bacterium]MDX6323561.1 gamma-glutamyltranspeptidase / glutathione hydrolase [Propionibacteriaceae bacterium]